MANLSFINIGLPLSGRLVFRNIHDLEQSSAGVSAGGSPDYYPEWWPRPRKRPSREDKNRKRILDAAQQWADKSYVPPRIELLSDIKARFESDGEPFEREYYAEMVRIMDDIRSKQSLAKFDESAIMNARRRNAILALFLLDS